MPHRGARGRAAPSLDIVPSSRQEEEAHFRAALRASAAEALSSSARSAVSMEREARRVAARAAYVSDAEAERWNRAPRHDERARWAYGVEHVNAAQHSLPQGHRNGQSRYPQRDVHSGHYRPDVVSAEYSTPVSGTAFYPTHATVSGTGVPNRVPSSRVSRRGGSNTISNPSTHDASYSAELNEAIVRSKEESELAEALQRSVLENETSSRKNKNNASPRGYGTYPDFFDGTNGIRHGTHAHHTYPNQSRKQEERDVAAAAFQSVVFGDLGGRRKERRHKKLNSEHDIRTREEEETLRVVLERSKKEAELEAVTQEAEERAVEAERKEKQREERRLEEEKRYAAREREKRIRLEKQKRDVEVAARMERKKQMERELKLEKERLEEKRVESELASENVAKELGGLDIRQALVLLGFPPRENTPPAVRSAYKKAALKFHPDRLVSKTIKEQQRGEEIWKQLGGKMDVFESG